MTLEQMEPEAQWNENKWLPALEPPTCPARGWHTTTTSAVTADGPNIWRCACGCRFLWTGPFHWWVLEPPRAGMPLYRPEQR